MSPAAAQDASDGALAPLWTAADVAAATGGTVHGDFAADHVTFDSREVIGGELFVALRGEATDGHRFVGQASERGAAGFLVSEDVDAPHVRAPDTMAALEALGRAARGRAIEATIVGVTGSVGKTGVKEALRASFELMAPERTHASVKSYNNHTGVPLSLARMPAAARWGVFEMGMNHAGELSALTRLVRPHVAVVTWVASAHRAFFATEADIAHAKAEIFEGIEPGGTAVVPHDNPHIGILRAKAEALGVGLISFGEGAGADVRSVTARVGPDGSDLVADVMGERLSCRIGMAGRHWVGNALCVLAAVAAAGGDIGLAGIALAEMTGLPGRGTRRRVAAGAGEALLIDESYNANPASVAAALGVLGAVEPGPGGRRLAVIGSMRELGAHSDAFHAGLAPAIGAARVDRTLLVGSETAPLADALGDRAELLPDAEAATAVVAALLRPGDVLLVKGSNSVGLSRLVTALAGRGA